MLPFDIVLSATCKLPFAQETVMLKGRWQSIGIRPLQFGGCERSDPDGMHVAWQHMLMDPVSLLFFFPLPFYAGARVSMTPPCIAYSGHGMWLGWHW